MAPKGDKKSTTQADLSHNYKPDEIVVAPDSDTVPEAVTKDRRGKDTLLVHAWLAPRDLSLLTPREIEATLENPKKAKATKDMIAGYKVAQDPTEWKRQQADAAALAAEELAQLEAAQDQLASDDEGAEAPKPEGKKRKRPSVTAAKDGDKKKKTTAKALKSKGDEDAAPASKKAKTTANPDDPAEVVKSWRHKLQKVFLGKSAPPASEMAACGEYFDQMENFEMKEEWLRESKLNKVLKRIALLSDDFIPEEDKYSFRSRSNALAAKWAKEMGAADSPAPPKPESGNAAPPAANGTEAEAKPATEGNAADEPAAAAQEEANGVEPAAADASEEKKVDDAAMKVDEPAPQANGDAAAEPAAPSEAPKAAADEPSAAAPEPVAAPEGADAAPATTA
ncbi:hypothetical protein JCM8202v2_003879 [Rhodotorula sphaerocarpa]